MMMTMVMKGVEKKLCNYALSRTIEISEGMFVPLIKSECE